MVQASKHSSSGDRLKGGNTPSASHASPAKVHFATDLAESVAFDDTRYTDVRNLIEGFCKSQGIPTPELST